MPRPGLVEQLNGKLLQRAICKLNRPSSSPGGRRKEGEGGGHLSFTPQLCEALVVKS